MRSLVPRPLLGSYVINILRTAAHIISIMRSRSSICTRLRARNKQDMGDQGRARDTKIGFVQITDEIEEPKVGFVREKRKKSTCTVDKQCTNKGG